jgi:hypothetical protein
MSGARSRRHRLIACATAALLGAVPSVWRGGALTAQGAPATRETLATFSGAILADSSERAIAGAVISLDALGRSTRSDSLGQFTLSGLPAGTHRASVRAVGYDVLSLDVVLSAGQRLEADLLLRATPPSLRAVEVTADTRPTSPFLRDFESRRRAGEGRFITREEIEAQQQRSLSAILSTRVPGMRVVRFSGKTVIASARGLTSFRQLPRGDQSDIAQGAPAACYVQVIVNDMVRYRSAPGETLLNVDLFDPAQIDAIEFYTVSQLPSELKRASSSPCGALVIWLRP